MISSNLIKIGLPEIGKIKIGIKGERRQGTGKEYQLPQKLDHFIVTRLDKNQTGNFAVDDVAHELLGDKPKEIPIRLLYNDIEANFQTRLACYIGKKVFCSGDGEKAMRAKQISEEEWDYQNKVETKCTCPLIDREYTGANKCKPAGKLNVMIDNINSIGGAYVFRTTSWNTIQSIIGSLNLIKSITNGELAGIPLVMTISPKQVVAPNGSPQTIHVVSIMYKGDMESLRHYALENATNRQRLKIDLEYLEKKMIANLDFTDVAPESDDFLDEFHPDQMIKKGDIIVNHDDVVTPPAQDEKSMKKHRSTLNKALQLCVTIEEFTKTLSDFESAFPFPMSESTFHNPVETFKSLSDEHRQRVETIEKVKANDPVWQFETLSKNCSTMGQLEQLKTWIEENEVLDTTENWQKIDDLFQEIGGDESHPHSAEGLGQD